MNASIAICDPLFRPALATGEEPARDALLLTRTQVYLGILMVLGALVTVVDTVNSGWRLERVVVLDALFLVLVAILVGLLRGTPSRRATRAMAMLSVGLAIAGATAASILRGEVASAAVVVSVMPLATAAFLPGGWGLQLATSAAAAIAMLAIRVATGSGPFPPTLVVLASCCQAVGILFALHERRQRTQLAMHRDSYRASLESMDKMSAELEQRVAERERLLTSASRGLQRSCRSLALDLEPLLGSMQASLREVAQTSSDDPQLSFLLHGAETAAVRMEETLEAMLAYGDLMRQPLQPVTVDLAELARIRLAGLRELEPRREVDVKIDDTMTTRGDAAMMAEVMQQLIDNAWQFTRDTTAARIEVGSRLAKDGQREFFVRDNGVGFEMAHAGQLFRPFTHLDSAETCPGQGMGLARAARIVERHGGRIRAQAAHSKGAEFAFTIGDPTAPAVIVSPSHVATSTRITGASANSSATSRGIAPMSASAAIADSAPAPAEPGKPAELVEKWSVTYVDDVDETMSALETDSPKASGTSEWTPKYRDESR